MEGLKQWQNPSERNPWQYPPFWGSHCARHCARSCSRLPPIGTTASLECTSYATGKKRKAAALALATSGNPSRHVLPTFFPAIANATWVHRCHLLGPRFSHSGTVSLTLCRKRRVSARTILALTPTYRGHAIYMGDFQTMVGKRN